MTQRVIMARLEATPGSREDLLLVLKAHAKRCLQGEPGTLQFDLLCPDGQPDAVLIYERYRDQAALDAHSNGTSIAEARRDFKLLVAKTTAEFCDVSD